MSLESNARDLRRHDADFALRRGFTFTVLDPEDGDVIGCVYLYPPEREGADVTVQSWVRADRGDLDVPLADAVAAWLETDWPGIVQNVSVGDSWFGDAMHAPGP